MKATALLTGASSSEEDEITENIHLPSSHLGMTHNPLIIYAVADRLAQAEGIGAASAGCACQGA